jgi:hypothetical protein
LPAGYHYKRVEVTRSERYHDKPDENGFSHPHDALQYLMGRTDEGRVVMRKDEIQAHMLPNRVNSSYSPYRWRAAQ